MSRQYRQSWFCCAAVLSSIVIGAPTVMQSRANAQENPTTTPATPGTPAPTTSFSGGRRLSRGAHLERFTFTAKLTPAVPVLDANTIEALRELRAPLPDGASVTILQPEPRMDSQQEPAAWDFGVAAAVTAPPGSQPPSREQMASALLEQLRGLTKPFQSLSPQERADRIAKNQADVTQVQRKIQALRSLARAQGEPEGVLAEKVKQLKAQAQAVRNDRMAKEARLTALTDGLEREKKRAQDRQQNDPIIDELQKLLKLREEDVKRSRMLISQGLISTDEARKSEDALAEVRIRLADRQAALGKSSKGELLDRLSDELAMLTIDMTDLQIQENQIAQQLKSYDASTLDEKRLDELMKQEPDVGAAEANQRPPLLDQLISKREQLGRERFGLMVIDVSIDPNRI